MLQEPLAAKVLQEPLGHKEPKELPALQGAKERLA